MKFRLLITFLLFTFYANAQNITFTSSNDTILYGDSIELKWNIKDVKRITKIQIRGVADSLNTEGSVFVKPQESGNYYLKIITKKKKDRYNKKVKVEVLFPKIDFFKTKKRENNDEDSTVVVWKTSNCKTVLFNGKRKLKQSGSLSFLLKKDTVFNLKAIDKYGVELSKNIKIRIKELEYVKGKQYIHLGDTITMNWRFNNCDSVQIDGVDKYFKPIDKLKISPTENVLCNFYTFKKGKKEKRNSFYVQVRTPIIKFKVPSKAVKNAPTSIKWEVDKNDKYKVKFNLHDTIVYDFKGEIDVLPDTMPYKLVVYDTLNNVVCKQSKSIKKIVRAINKFDVPNKAFANSPVQIEWDVASGLSVRIEGVGVGLPSVGKRTIIPFETTKLKLVVYKKGHLVDSVSQKIELFNRRKFVRKVIDVSEMSEKSALNFEIFSIDESKYPDEVKLYVLAVDDKGNFVSGLTKQSNAQKKQIIKKIIDISGNKKSKIKDFSFSEREKTVSLPYDISLALDYSGSMGRFIYTLESSVKTFLSNKDKTDRISITRFDHRLANVTIRNNDKDSLLNTFITNGLDTLGGCTALYAASDCALQNIMSSYKNKVLILFTDGQENSSLIYLGKFLYTAKLLAQKAKENNVKIHIISYGSGTNNSTLKKVSYVSGGSFYRLNKAEDIKNVFKELPIIFKNFYEIKYKPIQKKGEHTVNVVYDNLQGENIVMQNKYQVGKQFDIDEVPPGYENTYWQKVALKLNKKCISLPQAVAYFHLDKVNILPEYEKTLDAYVEFLQNRKNTEVVIFGHTDSQGNFDYCYDLSERRAEAVKKYVIGKGINPKRIHTVPCGKNQMIWVPEDQDWKAKENRRIEMLIIE